MEIRYNRFTKFYIEASNIIIKVIGLNDFIKIGYKDNIYNFLIFLEKNTFILDIDIKKFGINRTLIKLFMYYKVLVEYQGNSGIESKCFDSFIKNPNFLLKSLDDDKINKIYMDVEKGIYQLLNKNAMIKYNISLREISFLIDKNIFKNIGTCRLKKASKNYDIDVFLNMLRYIFSPRSKKNLFGIDRNFYKFGSGGGINSIFPVVITKNDDIFVFEKFSGEFFIKKTPGIYTDLVKEGLIGCDIAFGTYNYFVILCSYTKNVFSKYGNKGYKLILLEIGQISFMFRMLCGYFKKSHVELQGFYDDKIYDLLNKSEIFYNKDFLLSHILAISD